MNRTATVIRMQYVSKWTFVWVPLIILFGAFVLTCLIFALIPGDGIKVGGGIQAPLWYLFAMGIQALAYTFPFSQAMSVTRREFYLGTLASGAISIGGLSVITLLAGFVEDATDGWGANGVYFRVIPFLWEQSPLLAALAFFTAGMFLFTLGFLIATVYRRWSTVVLTVVLLAVGAVLALTVVLLTKLDAWGRFFAFFVDLGSLGTVLLGLAFAAVFAALAYLPLRRATA